MDYGDVFRDQYRQPCTIHSLQLLVKDILNLFPAFAQRYDNILRRAKVVCRKQHQSSKLSEAMSKQLPAPGETRWNGQYRLLEAIESSFEEVKFIAGGFLDSDLLPLRELINFLEPFYLLTKTLEAEQEATIHHVLPAFCNLERHIMGSNIPETLKQRALAAFDMRFGFIKSDMHLITAAVLSQHGFQWLTLANKNNKILLFDSADELRAKVVLYLQTVIQDFQAQTKEPEQVAKFAKKQKICQNKERTKYSLFGYGQQIEEETKYSLENHLLQHCVQNRSMSEELDPLQFWTSQPPTPLQKAAVQILVTPASSAPVERIFSHAGLICSARRTRMKDDLLSALVKAKYN